MKEIVGNYLEPEGIHEKARGAREDLYAKAKENSEKARVDHYAAVDKTEDERQKAIADTEKSRYDALAKTEEDRQKNIGDMERSRYDALTKIASEREKNIRDMENSRYNALNRDNPDRNEGGASRERNEGETGRKRNVDSYDGGSTNPERDADETRDRNVTYDDSSDSESREGAREDVDSSGNAGSSGDRPNFYEELSPELKKVYDSLDPAVKKMCDVYKKSVNEFVSRLEESFGEEGAEYVGNLFEEVLDGALRDMYGDSYSREKVRDGSFDFGIGGLEEKINGGSVSGESSSVSNYDSKSSSSANAEGLENEVSGGAKGVDRKAEIKAKKEAEIKAEEQRKIDIGLEKGRIRLERKAAKAKRDEEVKHYEELTRHFDNELAKYVISKYPVSEILKKKKEDFWAKFSDENKD